MNSNGKKPNILLIVADDMGCCDLGCMGNKIVKTPNIDSLAGEGLMLTQHYSASPMCAPARAALQTGKYPYRVGTLDVACHRGYDRIAPDEVLMPQIFNENGYATGLIGKWHNGSGPSQFHPCKRGYDEFIGYRSGSIDYFDWELEYTYSQPYIRKGKEYITDVFTDEAVKFIKKYKDGPFFLQLAYSAPHRPLEAPEEDIEEFRNIEGVTPGVAVVYAMIKKLDEGVGKVLAAIKELGLEKDTIVLFVSDNGPDFVCRNGLSPLRDPGFNGHKGDVLEGGIRVPGIIKWPRRIKAGTRSHEIVHFIDWMPTLLSASCIGTYKDTDMDGRDISDVLFGGEHEKREILYWQWSRYRSVEKSNAAVRVGRWKLYYPPAPNSLKAYEAEGVYDKEVYRKTFKILKEDLREETGAPYKPMLFDLEEDPGEQRNLSGEYPDLAGKMADMLKRWYGEVTKELNEKIKLTLVDE